jgi:hypothetical protein
MMAREAREVCSVYGYEVAEWCGSTYDDCLHNIRVQTPEGEVVAHSGDWIVREPDGSFRVRQLTQVAA